MTEVSKKVKKIKEQVSNLNADELAELKTELEEDTLNDVQLDLLEKNNELRLTNNTLNDVQLDLVEKNNELRLTNNILKENKKQFLKEIEEINRVRNKKKTINQNVIIYISLCALIVFSFFVAYGILYHKDNYRVIKIENVDNSSKNNK